VTDIPTPLRSGLLGRSILASRSPWLHEQEAQAQGLDLSYELFDFTDRGWDDDALAGVLAQLQAQGFLGVNVTYPFKQMVMPLLDELTESARVAGAVNTVAMREGRLIGHNTDMAGFAHSLKVGLPDAARARVLQLGAGGAGSAVAGAVLSLGVERLDLADVDLSRAAALADRLNQHFGAQRVYPYAISEISTDGVDGIINATPMGMAAYPGMALPAALIKPQHWVADIVYFPIETELLATARRIGCATLDGSGMVIAQAALAFEIIVGQSADQARMRASFAQFSA